MNSFLNKYECSPSLVMALTSDVQEHSAQERSSEAARFKVHLPLPYLCNSCILKGNDEY